MGQLDMTAEEILILLSSGSAFFEFAHCVSPVKNSGRSPEVTPPLVRKSQAERAFLEYI